MRTMAAVVFVALAAVVAAAAAATSPLPTPRLHGVAPSATEVEFSADPVTAAAGYRFKVDRLLGTGAMAWREDFAAAPEVSAGCALRAENVTLSSYTASAIVDVRLSDDGSALRIEAGSTTVSNVLVEVMSPVLDDDVTEVSYFFKAGSAGKSNCFFVEGRTSPAAGWELIGDVPPSSFTSSKTYVTNAVSPGLGYRQVRLLVTGLSSDFSTCAVDTFVVRYGGGIWRETVVDDETPRPEPRLSLDGLEPGRYAGRVLAVASGSDGFADSGFSDELVVDTRLTDVVLPAPSVCAEVDAYGRGLVSWTPVPSASSYLVRLFRYDAAEPLVREDETSETSLVVDFPAMGDYYVDVTAAAPGARGAETSAPCDLSVRLGRVPSLSVEAVAAGRLAASWSPVKFVTGYRVALWREDGDVWLEKPDFSGLSAGWPYGWLHAETVEHYKDGGPKLVNADEWIESPILSQPILTFSVRARSRSEKKDEVAQTELVVEGNTADGGDDGWRELAAQTLATTLQTVALDVPPEDDVRRLRLRVRYAGEDEAYAKAMSVEIASVSIEYGTRTATCEQTVDTETCAVTFDDVPESARLFVTVAPLDGEFVGEETRSETVDFSQLHFRRTGDVPISALDGLAYREDFSCLASVKGTTAVDDLPLDWWRFWEWGTNGTAAVTSLSFTTNWTTQTGLAIVRSATDYGSSVALGSRSSEKRGFAFEISFENDTDGILSLASLSFADGRLTEAKNEAEYFLEASVRSVASPSVATWIALDSPETGLNAVPRLNPGDALVLRWRHDRVTAGPALSFDDVVVAFAPAADGPTCSGGSLVEYEPGRGEVVDVVSDRIEFAGWNAPAGYELVVPSSVREVVGLPASGVTVGVRCGGSVVPQTAFVGFGADGTFVAELASDGVGVRPEFAAAAGSTSPFAFADGRVELSVKSIPGLTYRLQKGQTPDALEPFGVGVVATGNVVVLTDEASDRVFYRVEVTK